MDIQKLKVNGIQQGKHGKKITSIMNQQTSIGAKRNDLSVWFMAIRPQTLSAGLAPIIMGTGMAFGDGIHHWPSAFVALLTALLLQIGTNLTNDYFDFIKGADTVERIGPMRVMQAGLVTPKSMQCAIILTFALAILGCIWLVLRTGWPIALLAILAVLAGIFYTAGPRPLGYLGLGELFVFFFFGPVAVGGTYYVQSLEINRAVILAGIAPGLLASAILVVNNLRDIETDTKAGKRTLAVRFGKNFAQMEYYVMVAAAGLTPLLIYSLTDDHIHTLFACLICLLAFPSIRSVCAASNGVSLNRALTYTGKLLFIYSMIFSVGWIL